MNREEWEEHIIKRGSVAMSEKLSIRREKEPVTDIDTAFKHLTWEAGELSFEVKVKHYKNIIAEAADVMNYAAMIIDLAEKELEG